MIHKKTLLSPTDNTEQLTERLRFALNYWLLEEMKRQLKPEEWEIFRRMDPEDFVTMRQINQIMEHYDFDVRNNWDVDKQCVRAVLTSHGKEVGVAYFGA